MKLPSFVLAAAGSLTAAAIFAFGYPSARSAAQAATPPPTPPPIGTQQATPMPNPTTMPTASATFTPGPPATAKARPSPPPAGRKGLDGVWEVALQHPNTTDYTHINIKQDGDTLTGTYLDAHGKRYPLAGSVDGQAIRLIVTMPNGTTMLLEGRLDGTTDMVGMLTMPDGQIPFTAEYRAKEKWIENVNPSPGGIPSQGGYTPP
jgi:hypothetical protein